MRSSAGVSSAGSRGQADTDSAGLLCSGDNIVRGGLEVSTCPFLFRSSCLEFCQHGQIFSELDLSLLLLFPFRLKILSPANCVQLLKTKITLDKNINEKIIPRKDDEFL